MSSFQERFEEEVLKVGISNIANMLGVARNTVYNWIANGNAPLNMLMSLQGLMGVDVHYVMTGERTSAALGVDEMELLAGYRALDARGKAAVFGVIEGLTQSPEKTEKQIAKFIIHGDVGQSVETQTASNFTIDMRKERKKKE
jgi:hypothetical protein